MGCTGKWFWRKLQMQAVSKLNSREITPYWTETANTFCKGPVAGNCKLQCKLRLDKSDGKSRRTGHQRRDSHGGTTHRGPGAVVLTRGRGLQTMRG